MKAHQADVLGEQVDGVITRDGDGNLEFARQIGVAAQRFSAASGEESRFGLTLTGLADGVTGLEAVAQISIDPEIEIGPSAARVEQIGMSSARRRAAG